MNIPEWTNPAGHTGLERGRCRDLVAARAAAFGIGAG